MHDESGPHPRFRLCRMFCPRCTDQNDFFFFRFGIPKEKKKTIGGKCVPRYYSRRAMSSGAMFCCGGPSTSTRSKAAGSGSFLGICTVNLCQEMNKILVHKMRMPYA